MPFFNLLTGILTKPDLVDKGTEKMIVNVMQNLTYRLKKGYMIVRCRGQQEVTDRLSLAEATRKEMMFFQTHPYFRWDSLRQPCNWARGGSQRHLPAPYGTAATLRWGIPGCRATCGCRYFSVKLIGLLKQVVFVLDSNGGIL